MRVAEAGQLAEDKSATLELHGNLVVEGTLRMVAANPRVEQVIRFVDIDEAAVRGGGHEVLSPTSACGRTTGRLDIKEQAKASWTHPGREVGRP